MDAKEFNKLLDEIGVNLALNIQKGINKAAFMGERKAKQLCPVDTGMLRASITTDIGSLEASVGTNVEYAPFVEYGTSNQLAQPFMKPAKDKAQRLINKKLRKVIEESVK